VPKSAKAREAPWFKWPEPCAIAPTDTCWIGEKADAPNAKSHRYRRFGTAAISLASLLLCAPNASSKPLFNWHDKGREIFAEAVSTPTSKDRGGVPQLVASLSKRFAEAGLTDITVHDHAGTQAMIVRWSASGRPTRKPMLLLGHLDVVAARREDWQRDPFAFEERDGYFYGRGTLDMKSGVTAIVTALLRLKSEGFKPKRDIVVLFTGDEEIGAAGSRLAASQWLAGLDPEFALNADMGGGLFDNSGKSLGFRIQTSEKLFQNYTFTVRNPGGHSSRPREDNAIYDLGEALARLKAHRFAPMLNDTMRAYFTARQAQESGALGEAMRRFLANPSDIEAANQIEAAPSEIGMTQTTCVVTRMSADGANNALPQMAQATVNCRIMPESSSDAVLEELRAVAGPGVTVSAMYPPYAAKTSPKNDAVFQAYTRAVHKRHPGAAIFPYLSPGATDGTAFRAAGIPVYGVDGIWIVSPDDERAHGIDERLPVRAFYEDLDHWYDMIKELAR
jgi:acetylornithine deacetylase/succinyl-diaminopimelate desuccinylase-like protein